MNIIGSLLTASARCVECPESGALSDDIEAGVRRRQVTKIVQCYKSEVKSVLTEIDTEPERLLTVGGQNPDGTPANFVNWGGGFIYDGADVSEISPHFSRVAIRYKATNPEGGKGQPGTGSAGGGIVGRPWEGGKRYIETPASGKCSDGRIYIRDSFGWNLERQIDVNLICMKTDSRMVADALELLPEKLITNPHNGATINWGRGFSLVNIYGSSISPSFYAIGAKYRRNKAWAMHYLPPGVVLGCDAGVCSIAWGGVKFEEMDSMQPGEDDGLDVRLINANTILMTCNGIPFSDFTPGNTIGDKKLEWITEGNVARLMFMGEVWKEYVHG